MPDNRPDGDMRGKNEESQREEEWRFSGIGIRPFPPQIEGFSMFGIEFLVQQMVTVVI